MSLRTSFEALVPENIKNIPLLRDTMDIFLTNLEETAAVSVDLQNIFNVDSNTPSVSQKANVNLRETLLQVYLESVYAIIKSAQDNKELKKRLIAANKTNSLLFTSTPEKIIGSDSFLVGKHFNQSVGTVNSINQAHYLANKLETGVSAKVSPPKIKEPSRFNLIIESVLTNSMYASVVEPLSHPVGFTYQYIQLVELIMDDLFGFHAEYNVNAIEIRGNDGTYSVFTDLTGVAATDSVNADFLTRTNFLTGNLFTQQEINNLVTVYEGKIPKLITQFTTVTGRSVEIQFTDGTAIVQNPTTNTSTNLIYVNYDTWISTSQGIIQNFSQSKSSGYFSLFADYTTNIVYDYIDEILFTSNMFITAINDATGTAGGITYLDSLGNPVQTPNSDNIIMTSTAFVNETLTHSFTGSYLVSGNSYFTTSDPTGGFHLVCGL